VNAPATKRPVARIPAPAMRRVAVASLWRSRVVRREVMAALVSVRLDVRLSTSANDTCDNLPLKRQFEEQIWLANLRKASRSSRLLCRPALGLTKPLPASQPLLRLRWSSPAHARRRAPYYIANEVVHRNITEGRPDTPMLHPDTVTDAVCRKAPYAGGRTVTFASLTIPSTATAARDRRSASRRTARAPMSRRS
jgi:hypothetical protein